MKPSESVVVPQDEKPYPLPVPASIVENKFNAVFDNDTIRKIVLTAANHLIPAAVFWVTIRLLAKQIGTIINQLSANRTGSTEHSALESYFTNYFQPNITFTSYELELISNSMKFPNSITSDWKVLGGLQTMKKTLWQIAIMLKHSFSSSNSSSSTIPSSTPSPKETGLPLHLFQPIKSVLLYGPPGCGKSAIVHGLAKRLGWPILSVTPSSVFRKYVGETSQMTQATFSLLKKTKYCILFIDEVDALFRTRNDLQHQVDRNFLNEFMQLWDSLIQETNTTPILVIGATNRPQDLDPAIQRRFERSFLIGIPTAVERKAILKTLLAGIEKENGFDWNVAAKLTEGFNSNDLLNLCKAAVMIPVMERKRSFGKGTEPYSSTSTGGRAKTTRPLKIEDIRQALASFSPSSWNCKAYGESVAASEGEDATISGTTQLFPGFPPDTLSNQMYFPSPMPPSSSSYPSEDATIDEDDNEDSDDEEDDK